ncbi:MAG: acyl-CoA dehydrogenase [Zetaproteobacteria bacterium]|nr:acyl-CoA dehydrogenase [Zetaproteobacteria bacterium]
MDAVGFLAMMPSWGACALIVATVLGLGFIGAPIIVWGVTLIALLTVLDMGLTLTLVVGIPLILMGLAPIRKWLLSAPVMKIIKAINLLPGISDTERTALEAGHTWADKELFSGNPDFNHLLSQPYEKLSAKEQKFLDNQVEEVCEMADDEQAYQDGDMSKEVWDYLKREKFMGMIIPEEYGGLGFSALGHSEVVSKLGSCSIPLAISVMVPNSLGPAELLVHYGTQEQKDFYLPRLADGREIPCFGLTEPEAGSDAGSMKSKGVVFKGDDGKIYVRLNWEKRYITLGAVATVIGLAVKLFDPENILGKGTDLGITCFLIPSSTKGVVLGRRHDPLGVPFFNCPINGNDVEISIDSIVGGAERAGQGWRMLMESLAAGRSISLPAQSVGGSKKAARVVSAHAQIRQQFGLSIGKFEGVGEAMARIGAMTYMLEGMRVFTVGAVDQGIKPSVASAIAKYQSTEIARSIVNDTMDVVGGGGISQGPKNLIARWYIASPIGVTVEGANILTRTLIIFGQGAIRCHPYAYQEMVSIENNDLSAFDAAFSGHVGHVVHNLCRSLLLTLTRGRLASVPSSPMAQYYRKLSWTSASFAFLADVTMGTMGGALKFREKVTGRFADIFSWMYLITATLRRYEAEGRRKEDEVFVHFAAIHGFNKIDEAFQGLYANLDVPVVGWCLRNIVALWARINPISSPIPDHIGNQVVKAMMTPGETRDNLTMRALFMSSKEDDAFRKLDEAFKLNVEAEGVMKKVRSAVKSGALPKGKPQELVKQATEKGVISSEEASLLERSHKASLEAVQVDSFDIYKYKNGVANAIAEENSQKLASNG